MVSLKELPQRNNHLPVRSVSGIGFSGDSARPRITIRRPCLPGVKDIQNAVLLLLKSINSEGGIIIFTKPLSIFLILPDGLLVMFIWST